MTLPVFNFPNSTLKAQAASMAPWGPSFGAPQLLGVPLWTTRQAYAFAPTGEFAPFTMPPGAGVTITNPNAFRDGHGFYASVADVAGGFWGMSDTQVLAYFPYPTTADGFTVNLPSALALTGLAATGIPATGTPIFGVPPTGSTIICVSATGEVFLTNYEMNGEYGTISPGFANLARGATTDDVNLYTTLPKLGAIGLMNLESRDFSQVDTPFSMPGLIAASPTGVAVGGWALAGFASGAADFQACPPNPSTQAAYVSPHAIVMIEGTDPQWEVTTVTAGLTEATSLAWNPDALQVLVSDTGTVKVYDIVQGNFELGQTLDITGAGALAITSDGQNGLVCQSGGQVQILLNTLDIWSLGTTFSIASPVDVLLTSATAGWVLSSTNLVPITRTGNVWATGTALPLGFTGEAMTLDGQGNLYVTGGSGTTCYAALVQNGAVSSTILFTAAGYGISVVALQAQAAILLSDNQTIQSIALTGAGLNTLANEGAMPSSTTVPTGCSALAATPDSVWLLGTSEITQTAWEQPYKVRPYRSGYLGIYDGTDWATSELGVWHDPSALAWDASGNVWVATCQNDLYCFAGTATGTPSPLSQTNIPVYANQVAGTPMGFSSLTWFNGGLYATTLFPGAVVQLQ